MIPHLYGDAEVEAYAGPGEGVQSIKATEWDSYTRTMPHSEFPSASACICEVTWGSCLCRGPGCRVGLHPSPERLRSPVEGKSIRNARARSWARSRDRF